MGTAVEEVAWLNDEAEDPRKIQNRHRNGHNDAEDDDWTREYDVDQEIDDQERRCDSRLGHIDRIGRVLDAVIAFGLWGCSIFYYWVWFLQRHHGSSSADDHDHSAGGAGNSQQQQRLHVVVVISTALLGVLYGVRSVGAFGLRIITGSLLTVQIGLFILLMLKRSFYVQQQYHHHHGLFLFHLLCSFSATAIGSELVRLVLIILMQRRRRLRMSGMNGGAQEPLLDGVEWQMRRREWAMRTEDDPLWWSREEEEDDDEETVYSRAARSATMVEIAGRERFL
jgi:hypothetical protein